MNAPAMLFGVIYIFTIPESFRWLLAKQQNKRAAKHLLKVAKFSCTQLPHDLKETLETKPENIILNKNIDNNESEATSNYNIREIFKYPKFCLRIVVCAYCWLTNIFVYYGLSLTAVAIGGNKFTDFIYVSLIEIPATFAVIYAADRIGRKVLLHLSLLGGGIALLVSAFIPVTYWIQLTLFLIGKFFITVSFSTLYTYTSEMYPTNYRNTLFGFSSGFGRIGSILASQSLYIQSFSKYLPTYLFSGTALLACLLCLIFPETMNTTLPNTIEEALYIGKKHERKSSNANVKLQQ